MAQSAVRFSSQNEEIEPAEVSLQPVESLTGPRDRQDLGPEAQEELQNLASTMQQSKLQSKRMENFAYEPVSLPPSRVRSKCNLHSYCNSGIDPVSDRLLRRHGLPSTPAALRPSHRPCTPRR